MGFDNRKMKRDSIASNPSYDNDKYKENTDYVSYVQQSTSRYPSTMDNPSGNDKNKLPRTKAVFVRPYQQSRYSGDGENTVSETNKQWLRYEHDKAYQATWANANEHLDISASVTQIDKLITMTSNSIFDSASPTSITDKALYKSTNHTTQTVDDYTLHYAYLCPRGYYCPEGTRANGDQDKPLLDTDDTDGAENSDNNKAYKCPKGHACALEQQKRILIHVLQVLIKIKKEKIIV